MIITTFFSSEFDVLTNHFKNHFVACAWLKFFGFACDVFFEPILSYVEIFRLFGGFINNGTICNFCIAVIIDCNRDGFIQIFFSFVGFHQACGN
ncbi:hypothetical protein D3C86_1446760 [compost metagenome]